MRNKNETRDYLIGMGCDSHFAKFLSKRHEKEYLLNLDLNDLLDLGLRDAVANDIKSNRPAIPQDLLDSVLQKNLRICCVCYDENRSVILHHIKPYAKEKKHEEKNLAVLCIQCHGEAHTFHELEQNLDPDRLLGQKKSWEAAVAHRKKWTLALPKTRNSETRWDWLNITRLQTTIGTTLSAHQLELPRSAQRLELEEAGFLEMDGYSLKKLPIKGSGNKNYFTDIGEKQVCLTAYLTQLIEWVADREPVLDITDFCDRPKLVKTILKNDMLFCVSVKFSTRKNQHNEVEGVGRNKNLTIEFAFDDFCCMTNTSRKIAWDGEATNLVAFGTMRSSHRDEHNGDLLISMSPLGLAQRFSPNDYFEPGFFVRDC